MKNYHNSFDYLSKSFLFNFEQSPLAAYMYMTGEKKDTDGMRFGRLYHSIIAGDTDSYVLLDETKRPEPEKTFASKANKLWKNGIIDNARMNNKDIISLDEYNQILEMIERLRSDETVQRVNAFDLVQEEAFKADIKEGDITYKVKCKPDGLQIGRGENNANLVIDWKTCASVAPGKVRYDFVKFGYDVQAALYSDIISSLNGYTETNFLFVFQEKTEPYDALPVLVKWDSESMKEGRNKWRNYYMQARECFDSGIWPGVASKFDEGVLILD